MHACVLVSCCCVGDRWMDRYGGWIRARPGLPSARRMHAASEREKTMEQPPRGLLPRDVSVRAAACSYAIMHHIHCLEYCSRIGPSTL